MYRNTNLFNLLPFSFSLMLLLLLLQCYSAKMTKIESIVAPEFDFEAVLNKVHRKKKSKKSPCLKLSMVGSVPICRTRVGGGGVEGGRGERKSLDNNTKFRKIKGFSSFFNVAHCLKTPSRALIILTNERGVNIVKRV
jgi:hypothetical protein